VGSLVPVGSLVGLGTLAGGLGTGCDAVTGTDTGGVGRMGLLAGAAGEAVGPVCDGPGLGPGDTTPEGPVLELSGELLLSSASSLAFSSDAQLETALAARHPSKQAALRRGNWAIDVTCCPFCAHSKL
jgi:hypothetical protein